MGYSLRPYTPEDFGFLRDVHHALMRPYAERIWGWDEALQDALVREAIERTPPAIIVCGGTDAGQVSVRRCEDKIVLEQIFLLAQFQGQGIGASVVGAILTDADRAGLPVTLKVFKTNPAQRLYERLGFYVQSEDESSLHMRRDPQPAA